MLFATKSASQPRVNLQPIGQNFYFPSSVNQRRLGLLSLLCIDMSTCVNLFLILDQAGVNACERKV